MDVRIFVTTSHQRRYVDVIREALANDRDLTLTSCEVGDISATEGSTPETQPRSRISRWVMLNFRRARHSAAKPIKKIARRSAIRSTLRHPLVRFPFRVSFRTKGFLVKLFLSLRLNSYLISYLSDKKWQQIIDQYLFSTSPDLLVILEDNAEGLSSIVTNRAIELEVPYLILPDFIPNPAEPARFYYADKRHSAESFVGKIIAQLAPHWVLEFEGKKLLRLSHQQFFAAWMHKRRHPQPWILNAGYADRILLESNALAEHYRALGFREEKLKVIGGAVEDKLFTLKADRTSARKLLATRYGLSLTKPLLVCGFPPDQYTVSTNAYEFRSYDVLCEAWMNALNSMSNTYEIIVCPHPRIKEQQLAPFANNKIKISTEKLEDILPLADLYVACVSTTIRWALALGIPTVNFDCYRFRYGDFAKAKAIVEIEGVKSFAKALAAFRSQEYLQAQTALAQTDAHYWGMMDGKFGPRLRQHILETVDEERNPTSTHPKSFSLPRWPA